MFLHPLHRKNVFLAYKFVWAFKVREGFVLACVFLLTIVLLVEGLCLRYMREAGVGDFCFQNFLVHDSFFTILLCIPHSGTD